MEKSKKEFIQYVEGKHNYDHSNKPSKPYPHYLILIEETKDEGPLFTHMSIIFT